ncbi:MAG: hypothetical protein R3B51_09485 [Thermodesulfobacteriota bacterium]
MMLTMENIRKTSPVLKDMEEQNEIAIAGALQYDVESGKVEFSIRNPDRNNYEIRDGYTEFPIWKDGTNPVALLAKIRSW